MNPQICIHYTPGARGDFLASVLLDNWTPREFGGLNSPSQQYQKIHFIKHNKVLENYKDFIKIRIDDNNNINNLMQIGYNHFLKNDIDLKTTFPDQFFLFVRDFITRNRASNIDANQYDYYLDFSLLSDINFIENFYLRIRSMPIDSNFLELIKQNIAVQTSWTNDKTLLILAKLIDFENTNNLLHWYRNFSLDNFLTSVDPNLYLQYHNYSKVKYS